MCLTETVSIISNYVLSVVGMSWDRSRHLFKRSDGIGIGLQPSPIFCSYLFLVCHKPKPKPHPCSVKGSSPSSVLKSVEGLSRHTTNKNKNEYACIRTYQVNCILKSFLEAAEKYRLHGPISGVENTGFYHLLELLHPRGATLSSLH